MRAKWNQLMGWVFAGILTGAASIGGMLARAESLDPEQVGVVAVATTLDSIRGAVPLYNGKCKDTGTRCTVNAPCAVNGAGMCVSSDPSLYCTSKTESGVFDQFCDTTDLTAFCTTAVPGLGCFESFLQCQSTVLGCTCTRVMTVGQVIGTHLVC